MKGIGFYQWNCVQMGKKVIGRTHTCLVSDFARTRSIENP